MDFGTNRPNQRQQLRIGQALPLGRAAAPPGEISNLVDNAIKFTPAGGEVRVSLVGGATGPRIEVSDTGVGIPPGERSVVLQRFYRSEHTQHFPGSGLGLSIVAAVVNLDGYSLRIDDAQPGTRISIECWPH